MRFKLGPLSTPSSPQSGSLHRRSIFRKSSLHTSLEIRAFGGDLAGSGGTREEESKEVQSGATCLSCMIPEEEGDRASVGRLKSKYNPASRLLKTLGSEGGT